MFEPVAPRESAVDACEAALRRAILSGQLPAGTRLPAERRLADDFAVNRVTVRSALTRLAATGLVTARQGSGTVVSDFRARGGPDLLPGLLDLANGAGDIRALVRELLRVRRHLAQALMERLIEHPTMKLDAVRDAIEAFAAAVERDADQDTLGALDLDVLAALLAASESAVLQLCFNPVQRVLASLPALRRAMYAEPRGNVAGYRTLLRWLEGGGADGDPTVITRLLAERDARTLARMEAHP